MPGEARSAEEMTELVSNMIAPVRYSWVRPDFQARVRAVDLGPQVRLTDIEANGSVVGRDEHLIRQSPGDDVLAFTVHETVGGRVRQDGREARLGVGDAVFHDLNQPFGLDYTRGVHTQVLHVSRSALRDATGLVPPTAVAIPADTPILRVLGSAVRSIAALPEPASDDERLQLGATTFELLSAVVRSVGEPEPTLPAGRQALLLTMQNHVGANLGDPDLSPATLAERHYISLRYVHALFADAGVAPATYIRERRLRAAQRVLRNPTQAVLPITGIAFRFGFGDVSTFMRAYRRRFGHTPSQDRALALGGPVLEADRA